MTTQSWHAIAPAADTAACADAASTTSKATPAIKLSRVVNSLKSTTFVYTALQPCVYSHSQVPFMQAKPEC
jgi:hypothetical protein